MDELWINRKVYGGNKRVVNEFPATYALRGSVGGVRALRMDYLRRLFVLVRRGREMGYTEESRIEERKVRAGVSKRVAKCNLKKERTSSPTTTLSSPLTTTRLHHSILGQQPEGRRRRKVQSGLQFSSHTILSPLPVFPSIIIFFSHSFSSLLSSPFLFDFVKLESISSLPDASHYIILMNNIPLLSFNHLLFAVTQLI